MLLDQGEQMELGFLYEDSFLWLDDEKWGLEASLHDL
jgi:hypothetical protein